MNCKVVCVCVCDILGKLLSILCHSSTILKMRIMHVDFYRDIIWANYMPYVNVPCALGTNVVI